MTINEYLDDVTRLKRRAAGKFERFERIQAKATAPRSSLNVDGIPHKRNYNATESNILDAADALREYLAAFKEYDDRERELLSATKLLDLSDQLTIERVYIYNYRLIDPYSGICRVLGIRRRDLPEEMERIKTQLAEILRGQGVPIE